MILELKKDLRENKDKSFIFSSEDVLWWHKDVDKTALALKEFFTEIGFDDIKIIVYIRSQADLFLSLCSQEVKNADPTYNAQESKPKDSSRFQMYEYKNLTKAFMNTFGKENLIVKLFDRNEFYEGDLIKDFLHIFNIKLDESFIKQEPANESLDLIGFELLTRINNVLTKNLLGGQMVYLILYPFILFMIVLLPKTPPLNLCLKKKYMNLI